MPCQDCFTNLEIIQLKFGHDSMLGYKETGIVPSYKHELSNRAFETCHNRQETVLITAGWPSEIRFRNSTQIR